MDTLDAKQRIMNEIDSIDVQVETIEEKISELQSRQNQFRDAYTSIVSVEQQAGNLLKGVSRERA